MSNLVIEIKAPEITAVLEKLISVVSARTVMSAVSKQTPTPAEVQPAPVTPPAVSYASAAPAANPQQPAPMQSNQTMGAGNMAPVATPAPSQPVPAVPSINPPQQVPTAGAPQYTLDQIQAAISPLLMQGKGPQLQELLKKYGVQRLPDISADQMGAFATDLRGLGAQI